jgi:hypothetical protein
VKRILIVSANPKSTARLHLDEEVKEIETAIKLAKYRERFEAIAQWAVTIDELRRALLDYQPTIVHFSGHGAGDRGLVLHDPAKDIKLVTTEALAGLLERFKDKIECVFLNACNCKAQVEAIHRHIDCVIGMNQEISDTAARKFAVGFYDALGAGKDYQEAYHLGCNAIALSGSSEDLIPIIKMRSLPLSDSFESIPTTELEQKEPEQSDRRISLNFSNSKIYGAITVTQGQGNQIFVANNVNESTIEKQLTEREVIQMLVQLEELVWSAEELPEFIKQKSLKYLGRAKEELESSDPDKHYAADDLKRMAETLKNSHNTWENITPILRQLPPWLGVSRSYFELAQSSTVHRRNSDL